MADNVIKLIAVIISIVSTGPTSFTPKSIIAWYIMDAYCFKNVSWKILVSAYIKSHAGTQV